MLDQILSDKIVLVVITVVGMAICAIGGIGRVAAQGKWLNPFAILGYILGAVILLIVAAAVLNIQLPYLDSIRAAMIAVIVLIVAKFAFTQLHRAAG